MAKKNKSTGAGGSSSKIGVIPLADRVLIREIEGSDSLKKTASGIYIPNSKEDHGSKRGEVLAVGPGRYDEENLIPMTVKVGDTVLYSWGDTVKIGEEEFVMVSESNIIGIIK